MVKLAIVINKKAKNALQAKTYLDYLKSEQIEYTLYKVNPKDLHKTLSHCIKDYSTILIGGGDGSIRTAAQLCAHTPVVLGVLPLGTMNHFAKELSLPLTKESLSEALKKNKSVRIDLAEVNGHIFVNNSSIGFYPNFAQERDNYTKQLKNKWLSYIPGLWSTLKEHETFSLQLSNNNLNLAIRTSFLMISNNLYSYQFPVSVKRERFDEKKMGIYYFRHGRLRLLKIIRQLFNRKKNFAVNESKTPITIAIKNRQTITISLDGDTLDTSVPLNYKMLPKSLHVLTGDV